MIPREPKRSWHIADALGDERMRALRQIPADEKTGHHALDRIEAMAELGASFEEICRFADSALAAPAWASLNGDERAVLLALRVGRATCGAIGRAASLADSPTKRVLRRLCELGLVQHAGGRRGYVATDLGLSIVPPDQQGPTRAL